MNFYPKLKNIGALVAAIMLLTTGIKAQQIAPFKSGDRVVFTGNSITDGGHYHSYIWLYYLTRYPNMPIRIFNAGIGGDVAKQIDERLDDDVFAHNPTVITLTFGMNDTGYQYYPTGKTDSAYEQKIAISRPWFEDMEKKLLAYKKAKVIMIGSSPYDENSKIGIRPFIGKNAAMLKIAALQKEAAKQHGWGFVDFNAPVLNVNLAQEKLDSTYTLQGADRIHPTVDGHMVMAYAFLKAQGLAGKKVAGVSLNVKNHKLQPDNCTVTNVKVSPNNIQFTYLANALPYPIDTIPQSIGKVSRSQADALKLVPFTNEFNQETLQLSGLGKSKIYELTIDSAKIGKWTGADLDKGINLALYCSTPQYQQALAVMHLNEERWATERRLREYWWIHYSILKPHGLLHNDSESTADSLANYAKKDFFVAVTLPNYRKSRLKPVRDAWQKEIDLLTDELYRINKPKSHQFIIRPVSS